MILDDIAASARIRVEKARALRSAEAVRDAALTQAALSVPAADTRLPFEQALAAEGLSFICEVKRASPSRGIIAGDPKDGAPFPYPEIAAGYEAAGAAALSVLTEPDYFLGSDRYLRDIAARSLLPVLRKDFIVDPYQIYEAKLLGASAVLLICALLDTKTLETYIGIADSLGLSALVETHHEEELRSALDAGARIVGINNRDLKTFAVDLETTVKLRPLIPAGILTVSESGVKGPEDIRILTRGADIDGVLIGETLMRAADKRGGLQELRAAADRQAPALEEQKWER
ncbi:MAG: indole-3-glycerol phosphate synthase TrpC [Treponema sp.]|nr:indole-3-glycerol phosphate synthase TrpC [Treponema sp.]